MKASKSHKEQAPKTHMEEGATPPMHGKPSGGMSGGSSTHSGVSGGITAPQPKGHDSKIKIHGGIG